MSDSKKYTPQTGSFLISEPFLPDDNFFRTVVLLTEHNEEGSVGFVLNQETELSLNEVLKNFPEFDIRLHLGGPVQHETLHFLHRIDELKEDSLEVVPGVFWGGNFEQLASMITLRQVNFNDIRFFLGYSGWGPGQLDMEMERKSWLLAPAKEKFVFDTEPENLWKEVLSSMGKNHRIISNFPEDPSLN